MATGQALFSLLLRIDESYFTPFAEQLLEGTSFSTKFSNLKLCWNLLVKYSERNVESIFDNLSERQPDFALAAQGDAEELMSVCCVFLVFYFSINSDAFVEKICALSEESQFILVSGFNEYCGIDLMPKDSIQTNYKADSFNENSPFVESCPMKLTDLEARNYELSNELKTSKSEKAILLQQLKEQQNELDLLKQQSDRSIIVESLGQEIVQLQERLQESKKEIGNKELQLGSALRKLATYENSIKTSDLSANEKYLKDTISKLQTENALLARQSSSIGDLKRQIKNLEDQNYLLEEQLGFATRNPLINKDDDVSQELKNELLNKDKELARIQIENQEIKALLASYEERLNANLNSLCSSPISEKNTFYLEHQIVQLKDENQSLKERLSQLEGTQLDNEKNDSGLKFAIESLQRVIQEKDDEIAKLKERHQQYQESVQREQRLIMSTWYDIGTQAQKKSTFAIESSTSQTPNKQAKNSPSASWLQQQRNSVDYLLLNSK